MLLINSTPPNTQRASLQNRAPVCPQALAHEPQGMWEPGVIDWTLPRAALALRCWHSGRLLLQGMCWAGAAGSSAVS